ncbi:MAG: ChaN family lipoprotein [Thermodesulfobacteriota bacterium]
MISKKGWVGGVAFLIALTVGCATIPRAPLENPYGVLEVAKEGEIFHVSTGIRVSKAQLVNIIGDSRIIYVGETHDNVRAHQVQLEIIMGLTERFPGRVAVGMEMFQRSYQGVMDRWSRGDLSERDFLKESRWYPKWGMDYDYYKAILDYIREMHIPLLALNASSELVKEVRNHGLQSLSEPWQDQVPEMDLSDPHHRKLVEAFYKAHPPTSAKSFETFYEVYVLWDETMAETIANYLVTKEGFNKKVVVLAGENHVRYGFGIPRRAFRRLPVSYSIVLPMEVSIPEYKKDRLMDVKLPEIPLVPADFFWTVTYKDLKGEKVRLGVMLEEADGNLKVSKVLKESLAAKAGIQPGDILVSMDGEDLRESFDLLYLLDRKRPGDSGRLLIRREEKSLEMTVHFQTPK